MLRRVRGRVAPKKFLLVAWVRGDGAPLRSAGAAGCTACQDDGARGSRHASCGDPLDFVRRCLPSPYSRLRMARELDPPRTRSVPRQRDISRSTTDDRGHENDAKARRKDNGSTLDGGGGGEHPRLQSGGHPKVAVTAAALEREGRPADADSRQRRGGVRADRPG